MAETRPRAMAALPELGECPSSGRGVRRGHRRDLDVKNADRVVEPAEEDGLVRSVADHRGLQAQVAADIGALWGATRTASTMAARSAHPVRIAMSL